MRILHVLDFSPPFPGAVVDHLIELGRSLAAHGDSQLVAFPRRRPWFERIEPVSRVLVMPEIREPLRSGFAGRLRSLCRNEAVDLVHLWFSFALPFAVACSPWPCCLPIVHHWHNPPRALLPHSLSHLRPGGILGRTGRRARGRVLRALVGSAARFADRRAIAAHLVVSSEIRDLLLAHGWTTAEKIFRVPNALSVAASVRAGRNDRACAGGHLDAGGHLEAGGLDPRQLLDQNVEARAGAELVVGSVANFRPQKDHATLLRAFASVARSRPRARLVLVGDGPTRASAEAMARDLGLSGRVEFTGFVEDPREAYGRFDLFVLSTHYEGQGVVLLEAMSRGLPVVATDLPSIRETVEGGKDGLLSAPGDADDLAGKLCRLLDDPMLRMTLGRSGRDKVTREFGMEAWCRRVREVYILVRHSQARAER